MLPRPPAWRLAVHWAVDRDVFSTAVTEMVEKNSGITVHREEVTALDESVPVLVASGPLTEVRWRSRLPR